MTNTTPDICKCLLIHTGEAERVCEIGSFVYVCQCVCPSVCTVTICLHVVGVCPGDISVCLQNSRSMSACACECVHVGVCLDC